MARGLYRLGAHRLVWGDVPDRNERWWLCSACGATGVYVNSLETMEVEHCLNAKCDGRLVETVPPLRAFSVCQQCGELLVGEIRTEEISQMLHVTFCCQCNLVKGRQVTVSVSRERALHVVDHQLIFTSAFGLGLPALEV
jgi:hypothetical protein